MFFLTCQRYILKYKVVPLITGKPVEAQDINDDNFIVPWFSAKAQQNQVRKRRSGGSEGTF